MENYDNEIEIVKKLRASENWIRVITSSLIGLIPALVLTYFLVGDALLLMTVLPGIVVALTVKFVGKPISLKRRLFPAALLFLAMLGFCLFLVADSKVFMLPFTNAVVVFLFSKRSLSKDQKQALQLERQGKIQ